MIFSLSKCDTLSLLAMISFAKCKYLLVVSTSS